MTEPSDVGGRADRAERTIVCFGDSNTHGAPPDGGERFPRDVRWPGVLAVELGPGFHVVEEGLNGRTTRYDDPDVAGRNGSRYLVPCLHSHEPVDLLVLMLGTNDLKRDLGATAPGVARNVGHLVDLARESLAGAGGTPPRILVVAPPPLTGPTPLQTLWAYADDAVDVSRDLARWLRLVAEADGVGFLDAGEVAVAALPDGVHLDVGGHRALGRAVAAWVRAHPATT
jgi:lysophospholipase L1-like esterase